LTTKYKGGYDRQSVQSAAEIQRNSIIIICPCVRFFLSVCQSVCVCRVVCEAVVIGSKEADSSSAAAQQPARHRYRQTDRQTDRDRFRQRQTYRPAVVHISSPDTRPLTAQSFWTACWAQGIYCVCLYVCLSTTL